MGLDRFENMAEVKLLDYNLSKSKIMFLGKKKAREKLEREFQISPPTLYGKEVEVSSDES